MKPSIVVFYHVGMTCAFERAATTLIARELEAVPFEVNGEIFGGREYIRMRAFFCD